MASIEVLRDGVHLTLHINHFSRLHVAAKTFGEGNDACTVEGIVNRAVASDGRVVATFVTANSGNLIGSGNIVAAGERAYGQHQREE